MQNDEWSHEETPALATKVGSKTTTPPAAEAANQSPPVTRNTLPPALRTESNDDRFERFDSLKNHPVRLYCETTRTLRVDHQWSTRRSTQRVLLEINDFLLFRIGLALAMVVHVDEHNLPRRKLK